jgi:DNA-binding beta-propeller fold protein YncE
LTAHRTQTDVGHALESLPKAAFAHGVPEPGRPRGESEQMNRVPSLSVLPLLLGFACAPGVVSDVPTDPRGPDQVQDAGRSNERDGGSGGSGEADTEPWPTSIYRSPYAVAYSEDSALLAVTDATAGELVILDPKGGTSLRAVKLAGQPRGLSWSGAGRVMVAEYGAGTIAEVDATGGSIVRRLHVGPKPTDVAVSADRARLLVPDFGLNQLLILESATGKAQATVAVGPYPNAVALAPNGTTAVVSHLLASGDASQPDAAASLTLVDVPNAKVAAVVRLPFGSSSVRGVRCSPDGKWAYAVHTLGRTTIPTSQLLRGWINTDALSIVDLSSQRLYATVLLDRLSEGSANPWGLDVSRDGKSLWVSASGTHTVIRVDLALLHKLLTGPIPSELTRASGKVPSLKDRFKNGYTRPLSDAWFEIAADPAKRALLADDLGALYGAGALEVIRLAPAQGPRGIALSPDGKQLAVALYFAGQVGLVNTAIGQVSRFVDVGTQPEENWARQGERLFHDASSTLQGWLSCATCHVDGKSDGLNWDLMNNGVGDPKNTKPLAYAANTPPAMVHGVFAQVGEAISAEFKFTKSVVPEPSQEFALGAYFNALTAEPSPFRQPGGKLSAAAARGQAVFEKTGCDECHSGKYYTDLKMHDVGTKNSRDPSAEFDTPTLAGLWLSAPYLHDGSAPTLRDVLTSKNAGGRHNKASGRSREELDDLVQYLLELGVPVPEKVELFPAGASSPPKVAFRGENPSTSTKRQERPRSRGSQGRRSGQDPLHQARLPAHRRPLPRGTHVRPVPRLQREARGRPVHPRGRPLRQPPGEERAGQLDLRERPAPGEEARGRRVPLPGPPPRRQADPLRLYRHRPGRVVGGELHLPHLQGQRRRDGPHPVDPGITQRLRPHLASRRADRLHLGPPRRVRSVPWAIGADLHAAPDERRRHRHRGDQPPRDQ